MTETGMCLGTPHYMSPEQAMGEREITARSDVYALGCVLYEMLTGEPPFTGPTAQAIVARVMTEEPRSLTLQRKTVPPHVEAAVLTALAKLPADRFATAAQFGEALSRPGLATVPIASVRGRPRRDPRAAACVPWRCACPGSSRCSRSARPCGAGAGAPSRQSARAGSTSQLGRRLRPQRLLTSVRYRSRRTARASCSERRAAERPALAQAPGRAATRTPIPGTEARLIPAFSPDGEWIAFIEDGRAS